jgi:hypothetical protein
MIEVKGEFHVKGSGEDQRSGIKGFGFCMFSGEVGRQEQTPNFYSALSSLKYFCSDTAVEMKPNRQIWQLPRRRELSLPVTSSWQD